MWHRCNDMTPWLWQSDESQSIVHNRCTVWRRRWTNGFVTHMFSNAEHCSFIVLCLTWVRVELVFYGEAKCIDTQKLSIQYENVFIFICHDSEYLVLPPSPSADLMVMLIILNIHHRNIQLNESKIYLNFFAFKLRYAFSVTWLLHRPHSAIPAPWWKHISGTGKSEMAREFS